MIVIVSTIAKISIIEIGKKFLSSLLITENKSGNSYNNYYYNAVDEESKDIFGLHRRD